jgi:hypothetical protein
MGFCGGMSAGALHRFNHGIQSPPDTVTPVDGSSLFDELFSRQKRSLLAPVIPMLYDWQSAPDQSHWWLKHSLGYRTKREWPKLRAELDANRPTMIVLIRVEGYTENPTDNHQVLAIGYDYDKAVKKLAIQVYDPNRPGEDGTLSMNFGLPDSNIEATDSCGQRLRGFFVNPHGVLAAS